MKKLAELLREKFSLKSNQRNGIESVEEVGGVYDHVVLELNIFTLSDYHFNLINECAKATGYSWYMTPKGERESTARHFITFHK